MKQIITFFILEIGFYFLTIATCSGEYHNEANPVLTIITLSLAVCFVLSLFRAAFLDFRDLEKADNDNQEHHREQLKNIVEKFEKLGIKNQELYK